MITSVFKDLYHHSAKRMGRDRQNAYTYRFTGNADCFRIQPYAEVFGRITFPAVVYLFLRQEYGFTANPLLLITKGDFFSESDQFSGTGLFQTVRELTGHFRSRSTGTRRKREYMNACKAYFPDHLAGFIEFFFSFTGETGQDICRKGCIGKNGTQMIHRLCASGGEHCHCRTEGQDGTADRSC